MQQTKTKKLALAAMLTAVAVVGSMLSFPIFGSRCSPVQHMVNVLCAVLSALLVFALKNSGGLKTAQVGGEH